MRLLREYESCFWAEVEKGGCDPESWPGIEANYEKSRAKLLAYVSEVESRAEGP